MNREKVIAELQEYHDREWTDERKQGVPARDERRRIIGNALNLLKEQEELLKHEYWRGYNNGRADERGLQEGTIMQTFSPD